MKDELLAELLESARQSECRAASKSVRGRQESNAPRVKTGR
ncbi:hypothetical protein [Abditibacterium utsteinense]|nr:hypothetical protein [Abditibacterium utsteinense]